MRLFALVLSLSALLLGACVAKPVRDPVAADLEEVDIGIKLQGYTASVVAKGMKNPTWVTFRPGNDALTICDSGNGRVVVVGDDGLIPVIDGMHTQYWKNLDDGRQLFKVGPLTGAWLNEGTFAVTNGGVNDGDEQLLTYRIDRKNPANNEVTGRSETIPPTTQDEADKGEGNLSGMALMEDGNTYFLCGQGFDGKTWILRGSLDDNTLKPWASADENSIEINSPMQCLPWRGNLLVIYSGTGGESDGLAVEWDTETKKPINQWNLGEAGIIDPMGIALVPDSENEFVVTDNVWTLEKVNPGKLYRVRLLDGEKVEADVIADNVPGPVHCAFGPDGRLYVSCLGWEYDKDQGQVIAIDGLERS